VTRLYYQRTKGIVVVYDIAFRSSFDSLDHWFNVIAQEARANPTLLLIGNKADLHSQRQVSYEEAKALADAYRCLFIETSAKTGANVRAAFSSIACYLEPDTQTYVSG
jgi:small GTP-binding protein